MESPASGDVAAANCLTPNCLQAEISKDGSFYGVFVETDKDESGTPKVFSKLKETLSAIKSNKTARFKIFKSASEAEHFSIFGQESPVKPAEKILSNNVPSSFGFKSLKSEELVAFRRLIESGDVEKVKQAINSNPKFLVSSGDTPSIIQEGCRYNAMHVAARYNQAVIIHFIMKCVTNPDFIKSLYGIEQSYLSRSEIITDLYLNTPDKAANDTPLHIASKFGHVDVVRELVSYDKCILTLKNKYGQIPKDVICSRENKPAYNEILNLLEDGYFVPMWKSDDDCVQPTIGKPFSPKSSPVVSVTQIQNECLKTLSPVLEIRAIAGPMNESQAQQFWKDWKSPVRKSLLSPSPKKLHHSPKQKEIYDKSFEKAGRGLAEIKKVGWAEYWPFLDRIVDLRTERGLDLLENNLKQRFGTKEQEHAEKLNVTEPTILLSPMGELCKALETMRIGSNPKEKSTRRSTHVSYTCLAKSCKVLSERLLKVFISESENTRDIELLASRLCHEVRHLLVLEDSFYSDSRFDQNIQGKIHERVALSLCQLFRDNYEINLKIIELVNSLKSYYMFGGGVETRSENTAACITQLMSGILSDTSWLNCLQQPVENEEDCKAWFLNTDACLCSIGYKSRLKPKQLFMDDDELSKANQDDVSQIYCIKHNTNEKSLTLNVGNDTILTNGYNSDDEIYLSAPSSPCSESSDDYNMFYNAERDFSYLLFSSDSPTNDDHQVYDVLQGLKLDANKYPWLYRWLYSMNDYYDT